MFGLGKSGPSPLQLYGKLPLAKDYLRLGLGDGAGLALRDWLDAAFSGSTGTNGAPELAWPARFVAGKAWGGNLIGCLWPSSDTGGLRPFPFALCVERPRKELHEDTLQAFQRCRELWRALNEHFESCRQQADGRAALAALRGRTIDWASLSTQQTPGVPLEPWLRALWPEDLRDGLRRALIALGNLPDSGGRAPLRLPLAPGSGYRDQVQAWLEIADRLRLIDERATQTVFFPQATVIDRCARPFLVVFRDAAQPRDAAWLASPDTTTALGPTDLVGGRPPVPVLSVHGGESVPPLSSSLRGILAGLGPRSA